MLVSIDFCLGHLKRWRNASALRCVQIFARREDFPARGTPGRSGSEQPAIPGSFGSRWHQKVGAARKAARRALRPRRAAAWSHRERALPLAHLMVFLFAAIPTAVT